MRWQAYPHGDKQASGHAPAKIINQQHTEANALKANATARYSKPGAVQEVIARLGGNITKASCRRRIEQHLPSEIAILQYYRGTGATLWRLMVRPHLMAGHWRMNCDDCITRRLLSCAPHADVIILHP